MTTEQHCCAVPQQPDEIRKLGRGMAGQLHVVWGINWGQELHHRATTAATYACHKRGLVKLKLTIHAHHVSSQLAIIFCFVVVVMIIWYPRSVSNTQTTN